MRTKMYFQTGLIFLFLFSCSQQNKSIPEIDSASMSEVSSVSEESVLEVNMTESGESSNIRNGGYRNFLASHAASSENKDKYHKLIRSAQMKFRVETVPQATFDIEEIALKNGGIILKSSISNNKSYSTTINISEDSALVMHYSDLVANIQLKIPQCQLDTVLRQIAPLAIEIDHRIILSRDVTLQIMADSLKQVRVGKKSNRITNAIDNKNSILNDVMDAEEVLDNSLEQSDQSLLSTFSLNEQIEFSTVDINLYQNQIRYTEKVLRVKDVEEYNPSMGSQVLDSLENGWYGISIIFIFFLNLWPLFLIIAIAIFFGIKYKCRKKGL